MIIRWYEFGPFGTLLLNLNFVLDHHLTLVPLARNLGYFAP